MKKQVLVGMMCATAAVVGCQESRVAPVESRAEFDFTDSSHGWVAGFSDYSEEMADIMELDSGHRPLPEGVEREGSGLFIAGTNRSDDLFMFWKGRTDGLLPSTAYEVEFTVEFASDAPSDCVGIGGPPAESVYVKVGATAVEPQVEQVEGRFAINIDKGNQSTGGSDAHVIGHVGTTNTDCNQPRWELKTLTSQEPLRAFTDAAGALWLFVGTDSGFEGRTQLYYTQFRATLSPVDEAVPPPMQ